MVMIIVEHAQFENRSFARRVSLLEPLGSRGIHSHRRKQRDQKREIQLMAHPKHVHSLRIIRAADRFHVFSLIC